MRAFFVHLVTPFRATVPVGVSIACLLAAVPCRAQPNRVALVDDPNRWIVNVDRPGAKISMVKAESGLAVAVTADGGEEDFPKAHRQFAEPQDWHGYTRLNMRLRVVCDDPAVHQKMIALVFYDEQTRLDNVAGHPMKQQCISHTLPVNQWLELSAWLAAIRCSTIRQLDLYMYELPPAKAHQYRWEVARLDLERIAGDSQHSVFDTLVFPRAQIQGAMGKPVGTVSTQEGLQLEIGCAGELARVAIDGKTVGTARRDCPSGLLVRDVARNGTPIMVGGRVEKTGQDVKQTAELGDLGLNLNATFKACAGYTEIAGTVADSRGQDRAVTVYLAIPLAEGPWKWWDSVAAARTDPGNSTELSCLETDVGYGMNGCHSKYPLGALTLPGVAGLTLAIRMDEPVVHRIAYNPQLRMFYLAIDFGLVSERRADGRPLSEAPFRILVYRHDPAWGFRSALQRYYEFFPTFFTKRIAKEGSWFVWNDISKLAGALDAGFAFHWGPNGAEAVKWDNAHGPLALFYIEPQTYQQTMEDFTRQPSTEEVLERLRKLVQGNRDELAKVTSQPYRVYPLGPAEGGLDRSIQATAQAVMKSLNHDIAGQPYCLIGQLEWMSKSRWGAIFSCNLAPGIPDGKGQLNLQRIIAPSLQNMEKAGARYDGIALDSLGGFGMHATANYRREHFRHSTVPLSFSANNHQPVQVASFTTVEWVSDLAKAMHASGRVLMANCSWSYTPGWLTFVAPYLDIFGAEAPEFADPDFIRAIAYRRPCTDLPYTPRPAWEVPRHWLQAIHPGHGNEIKAMQSCAGLMRDLIAAGWEPITGARVTPDQVRIERYGAGNRVYLVLHNPDADRPVAARVQLDIGVLGAGDYAAVVHPAKQDTAVNDGRIEVSLAPRETLVLAITRR